MHPFFDPLSPREVMLLLTTLTLGGSKSTSLFSRLPPDISKRLLEKAEALSAIAKEKRVPFMVKQIQETVQQAGLGGIERIDPSWIVHGMRGEGPRTVAAILISLPPQTAQAVLKRLPPGIRKNLPPKDEMRRVRPDVTRLVRQIFDTRFAPMPGPTGKKFSFPDIIQLDRPDLRRLMRDLGLIELGQAFAAVGKRALTELCRRLPRRSAQELIRAVAEAPPGDPKDLQNAKRFLSRVVVNFKSTEEFFRNAGLWRLAKASAGTPLAFRTAFQQRIPRDAGELLKKYQEKTSEIEALEPNAIHRLQDTVLLRVKYLSEQSAISNRWAQTEMAFHDPNVLRTKTEPESPPIPETPEPTPEGQTAGQNDGGAEKKETSDKSTTSEE